MRRETSAATCFNYDIPIGDQIRLMSAAGFTHVALSVRAEHSGYLCPEGRTALKSSLKTIGMAIDTIHGPGLDGESPQGLLSVMEAADDLGVERIVVHPGPFNCSIETAAQRQDRIVGNCEFALRVAERLNIVLAVENVFPGPATDLAKALLRRFDTPRLGFCYDSSHDQIDGPRPFDLLDELGPRLVAVHLSDRIREFVDHVIPGEGFIDWKELCQRLRAVQYDKPVLMEIMMQHSRYKDPADFLAAAHKAAISTWQAIHK